jgi:HAD superfamily hydrolase (TIGR01509 family)
VERQPELLAFDLMDTVVTDPFLPVLRRLGQGAATQLLESLDSSAWIDFELGRIDEPQFLGRLFHRPPPHSGISAAVLRDAIFDGYAFVGGMEALLEELRSAGSRLWVLSNYPPWAELVRSRLRLDRYFDGYAVSYQIGARKPDPAAYLGLCRQCQVAPERCLLIDDRLTNVEGARRVGMPALHFDGAEALRRELVARGTLR